MSDLAAIVKGAVDGWWGTTDPRPTLEQAVADAIVTAGWVSTPARPQHPWAKWPFTRCRAVMMSLPDTSPERCDLKKRHAGAHRAERGMFDVCWQERMWTE